MELKFSYKYKDYELRACPKRLVRFNEDESKNGAIISFLMMIVIIVAWTIFFSFF